MNLANIPIRWILAEWLNLPPTIQTHLNESPGAWTQDPTHRIIGYMHDGHVRTLVSILGDALPADPKLPLTPAQLLDIGQLTEGVVHILIFLKHYAARFGWGPALQDILIRSRRFRLLLPRLFGHLAVIYPWFSDGKLDSGPDPITKPQECVLVYGAVALAQLLIPDTVNIDVTQDGLQVRQHMEQIVYRLWRTLPSSPVSGLVLELTDLISRIVSHSVSNSLIGTNNRRFIESAAGRLGTGTLPEQVAQLKLLAVFLLQNSDDNQTIDEKLDALAEFKVPLALGQLLDIFLSTEPPALAVALAPRDVADLFRFVLNVIELAYTHRHFRLAGQISQTNVLARFIWYSSRFQPGNDDFRAQVPVEWATMTNYFKLLKASSTKSDFFHEKKALEVAVAAIKELPEDGTDLLKFRIWREFQGTVAQIALLPSLG